MYPAKAKLSIALSVSVNDLENVVIVLVPAGLHREPRRFFLKKFSLCEPHFLTLLRFFKKMKRETTPQIKKRGNI